jgi:hypothetical protein
MASSGHACQPMAERSRSSSPKMATKLPHAFNFPPTSNDTLDGQGCSPPEATARAPAAAAAAARLAGLSAPAHPLLNATGGPNEDAEAIARNQALLGYTAGEDGSGGGLPASPVGRLRPHPHHLPGGSAALEALVSSGMSDTVLGTGALRTGSILTGRLSRAPPLKGQPSASTSASATRGVAAGPSGGRGGAAAARRIYVSPEVGVWLSQLCKMEGGGEMISEVVGSQCMLLGCRCMAQGSTCRFKTGRRG